MPTSIAEAKITPPQLKRLQVLYAQLARHTLDGGTREDRLRWASEHCGRPILSFGDLTAPEATRLIDGTQGQLGVKAPAKRRRRLDYRAAQRAGTEGRHDGDGETVTLVSAQDLARISYAMTLLGWDQATLDRWLASPRSPIGGRHQIRTLGDANRVWWALKRMAIKRKVWKEKL